MITLFIDNSKANNKIVNTLGNSVTYYYTNRRNDFMKNKTIFFCNECGYESSKWLGKCPACGVWNSMVEEKEKEIDRYRVEIYKKYALPAACIIFVLLGAPLGVMVKKGGFGMAASVSLFFVVIYWAFLIVGEKLADRDMLSPFMGMWAANIVLGITGFLLMIKAAKEAVIIKFDFLKKIIPKHILEMGQGAQEAADENYR